MNLDQKREKFVNDNLNKMTFVEEPFSNPTTNLSCKDISQFYHQQCNKINSLSKVREFYDDNWYNKYENIIDNITNLNELKTLMEKMIYFKNLLGITKELDQADIIELENYINNCIKYRIQFKYKCIAKSDTGHDAEILRHIFYFNRYNELKSLFVNIKVQYFKQRAIIKRRRDEEDKIIDEIDRISNNSNESMGEPFQQPVSKKKKKTSRPKYKKK